MTNEFRQFNKIYNMTEHVEKITRGSLSKSTKFLLFI